MNAATTSALVSGPCECEHIAHDERGRRTPNGNPGHRYFTRYAAGYLVTVHTTRGNITICKDCAKDCHHGAPAVTP